MGQQSPSTGRRTARRRIDVFCFENNWSPDLRDQSSVRPVLEMLREVRGIQFVHQTISVPEALSEAARVWRQKRYANYRVGYFAFHGRPGAISIGRKGVRLANLAELLGNCSGKVIHLGGCSIMPPGTRDQKRDLGEFCRRTPATAVCGYTTDVDWVEAMAFDTLLLDWLNTYPSRPRLGIRYAETESRSLAKNLGFVSFPR